jgi:hypothetical protein
MFASGIGMFASLFTVADVPMPEARDFQPDYLYVLGDMNFRVDMPYTACMSIINSIKEQNLRGQELQTQINEMLGCDQLSMVLKVKRELWKLRERMITFLPTFKLEEKRNLYQHEKQRTPSWSPVVT